MENTYAIIFFKFLLSTLLFVIFLVPILLVIVIFLIYRTIVLIILKLKFGSQFGGILTGLDAFFAADIASGCVINMLVIVKTRSSFQEFFRKFKEEVNKKIFRHPQRFPKFLSRRNRMCGYHYFIQNQISIDKCIRGLHLHSTEEEISKEELIKGISNYYNKILPYNNTAFWEFLLCEKPVRWHNRTDKSEISYAVLLRFHHSLADGINLVKFMLNTLFASIDENKIKTHPGQNNLMVKIRDILSSIFILLMAPVVILSQKLFWYVESSSVDVPSLSNQKIFVVKAEESRECLKIIKGIKQKVENTSFVEVLLTAVSISLSNYFLKKGKDPNLNNFGSFVTVLMKKSHLQLSESKITNIFSYKKVNIPIIYKSCTGFSNCWTSFMDTLKRVKIENKHLIASIDYKVNYRMIQLLATLLPESLTSRLIIPPYLPFAVTNFPGPSAITFLDDCLVDDVMYWVPCLNCVGITLGIFSYDQRLQITLNVDEAIISSEGDAQGIVDGVHQALINLANKI